MTFFRTLLLLTVVVFIAGCPQKKNKKKTNSMAFTDTELKELKRKLNEFSESFSAADLLTIGLDISNSPDGSLPESDSLAKLKSFFKEFDPDIFERFLYYATFLDKLRVDEEDSKPKYEPFFEYIFESIYIRSLFGGKTDKRFFVYSLDFEANRRVYAKYLKFINKVIDKHPEKCSLYVLRSFWAALNYKYDHLFDELKTLEKLNTDNWSVYLIRGFAYFQKQEDDKAIKNINSSLKSLELYYKELARDKEFVIDQRYLKNDYTYNLILKIKKRMDESKSQTVRTESRLRISNHKDCYFIEINEENNEEGESVSWTGECKNGWAEGEGELIYKKSKSRHKVFMKKGRRNGPAEITFKDGRKFIGKFKNDVPKGKWELHNKKRGLIQKAPVTKNFLFQGEGSAIFKNSSGTVKFEGTFKNNNITKNGKAICFYGTDKENDYPYEIYRSLKESDAIFIPLCDVIKNRKKLENWKETNKKIDAIWKKGFEKTSKHLKERTQQDNNCSLSNGFSHIVNDLIQ